MKLKLDLIPDNVTSGNDRWEYFENSFNFILNKHAPLRTQTRKEQKQSAKPWITSAILKSIKTKQKLYKLFLLNPKDRDTWYTYKKFRNILTHTIEKSKQTHFQGKIFQSKSNSKKLWKTINEITQLKKKGNKNSIEISDSSGKSIIDPIEVSNSFNKFFTSIGSSLSNNLSSQNLGNLGATSSSTNNCKHSLFLKPMTTFDVKKYISNLEINKSTRSDCPSIKFVKLTSNLVSPIIADIFNQCIIEGVFPNSLKIAEVIPIFKKGDKTKINNYRPISLLSPFSKIFEKHISNQINSFISKHNLLYKYQYGFQENNSTEIALQQLCDNLTSKLDKSETICATFIDLAKAFDTVNHNILVKKLPSFGIRGAPAKLLENYLTNRTQITIVNGTKSKSEPITCGVPQGSILGPLLFLLFINDLPNSCNLDVKLFADDACLIYSDKNLVRLQTTINTELNKVDNWIKVNKLSVNYTKSNYIIFTTTKFKSKLKIEMGGHLLDRVKETKYLGIILNENLKWNSHINSVKKKISRGSYILSKIRHYVDIQTLKMLYYSLIHPHLNYCITSWGGAPPTTWKPLYILQKKIVRIMTNSNFDSHSAPLFKSLEILNWENLYKYNLAIAIHKIFNNKAPGSNNLTLIDQVHHHFTRLSKSKNFHQHHHNTNLGQSSYTNKGIVIWKTLPTEFKSLPLVVFKSRVKNYLLDLIT